MKHLSDFEIEEMTQAIAALKNVHIDLMDRILEEFEQHLMAGEWVSQGGADFARQALERAVGPRATGDTGSDLISDLVRLLYLAQCPAGPDRPLH